MKLFIRVKFRTLGITLGTVQQEIDAFPLLVAFAQQLLGGRGVEVDYPGVSIVARKVITQNGPIVLFDQRGIYVEVR